MSFLYWFPKLMAKPTAEQIGDAGLTYALSRCTARGVTSGPDSDRGLVVVEGGNDDGKLGYYPDRQTWRRMPQREQWVGYYTDAKPAPRTLARAEQISGRWITADDGSQWLAPIARRWQEMNGQVLWDYNLPRRMELGEDGRWLPGGVTARYERLWMMAMAYEEAARAALAEAPGSDDCVRFVFDDIDVLAIGALQVNYRVGPVELDCLGVYDMAFRQRIIDVLLDTETWSGWIKKKLAAAGQDGGSL